MDRDLSRYARQMTLPGVGKPGQERLLDAHALVVGCGSLGCVAVDQLCRAGIGRLTIVDRDLVEPGNLQRQVLFDAAQAAARLPKAEAAHARVAQINPDVRVAPVIADLRPSNAESIVLRGPFGVPGVILDGTDNFETRFLLNDLSVKHAIVLVYAGVVGTRGMRAVFRPGAGACLRCVFDRPPAPGSQPTCESAGVLGPAAAIIGAQQAAETIKLLVGDEQHATDLAESDAWTGVSRSFDLAAARDPDCPCCVRRVFEHLDAPDPESAVLCGRSAVQVMPPVGGGRIDFDRIERALRPAGEVSRTPFMVRATLAEQPGVAVSVFRDGRAVFEGIDEPARARTLYARYIGV